MKHILLFIAAFAVAIVANAQDTSIKSAQVYRYAGVPSNGTNEVQTLTISGTPSGGYFVLNITGGRTTGTIPWSATNATLVSNIDTALEGLSAVGTNGVTTAVGSMTAGVGTITLTFVGKNARSNFPAITVTGTGSLTGPLASVAIATTTPGVLATFRDAPTGTLLVDTATPDLYINDSLTTFSPTWTKVSP